MSMILLWMLVKGFDDDGDDRPLSPFWFVLCMVQCMPFKITAAVHALGRFSTVSRDPSHA